MRLCKLYTETSYDYPQCTTYLKKRGIFSLIARHGAESNEMLSYATTPQTSENKCPTLKISRK